MKRAEIVAALHGGLGLLGLGNGLLGADDGKGVEHRLHGIDAPKHCLHEGRESRDRRSS